MRRNHILILCAAFLVTLPLITNGCSCGHDFDFHIQSWLEAAQQFRYGTLLPHWAFSAAYNAGEPRFIFYPPLSWVLGALLTLIFPIAAIPAIYTFIVIAAVGLAMHRLVSHFASANAALIATALYIANPYMLFTAFERTAYAELLAAAWLPLLFLAILRERPTVRGIALPIALLWLTNAPAAVMGCYALALIVVTRIVLGLAVKRDVSGPDVHALRPLHLAFTSIAGTALGLALPAFYLIPAAYERRFVQIALAITPNMRFQDNFLFSHTSDMDHNEVLHTASLIAVTVLALTIIVLLVLLFRSKKIASSASLAIPPDLSHGPEHRGDIAMVSGENWFPLSGLLSLGSLTVCIGFLFTPLSTPLWNHLPELAFLQFPWRLLSLLAVVFALGVAVLLRNARLGPRVAIPLSLALVAGLALFGIHAFREECDDTDFPAARAQLFLTHHGVEPTNEYTPASADNHVIRPNEPAYWLSPDPQAFAPDTTPNPAAINPHFVGEFSSAQTLSAQAPHHFEFHADRAEFLILNLREYPAWDVTETDSNSPAVNHAPHVQRRDGLIAIPLYHPADYKIDIRWRRTFDQQLGLGLSAIALCIYLALSQRFRSRRIEV